MNKISLVARRRNKAFDSPTEASERARKRIEDGEPKGAAVEAVVATDPGSDEVSVSMEEGIPTVELDVPADQHLSLDELAEEYLSDQDQAQILTTISKEKVGGKWGLRLQFMPDHPAKLLSSKELASMLGVSLHTIYHLRKSGKIKGYKAGRTWRFVWSEVLDALEDKS